MTRFKTLLQREWMQHHRGWIALLAVPLVLCLGAAAFGDVHFGLGDDGVPDNPGPLLIAMGAVGAVSALTLVLACAAALLQSPGLARRDAQDRSIEFWLSLPAGHAQSLAATLLAHLVLLPWAALGIGVAGGLLVALLLVAKGFGIAAWFTLPWGWLLLAGGALALRIMLGLLLATLWLSPLILGTMAASAWLKRWGVPVVAGVLGIGGLLLDKIYGITVIGDALRVLGTQASRALFAADRAALGDVHIETPDQMNGVLSVIPGWALADAGHALALLVSPAFIGALLVGAAAFGLLWLRRQRGV